MPSSKGIPLPSSPSPPQILIIGAGQRGRAYAKAVRSVTTGLVVAVAEPDDYKRSDFGRSFIWGEESCPGEGAVFKGWRDFVDYEEKRRARVLGGDKDTPPGVDAAFVCVQDEMHREVVLALAKLGGLHIMCEKPLATCLQHCVDMYEALRSNTNEKGEQLVFSIGHVLRYSPHNMLLRKLVLEDRVIGDILSVVHTEPVGWWHFTHSYVRGNWRRESTSAPSLLTKSCHDIDILLWLLCSPPSCSDTTSQPPPPHLPATVSSVGSLQYFKKSRKPIAAGAATNCLSCPMVDSCKYSAKEIYLKQDSVGLESGNTDWPVSIVVPDIESYGDREEAKRALLSELAKDYDADTPDAEVSQRNWFGRCVYESDNDVCDEQVVTITWEDDPLALTPSSMASMPDPAGGRGSKTATFHMVAQTQRVCERYTRLYGVDGEIYADSTTITVQDFKTGETITHQPPGEGKGHGGGDLGLARQFVMAVDKVKNGGWPTDRAQRELIGCSLDEVIRSHAMVFCAEDARRGKKVVDWAEWWAKEVDDKLGQASL